MTPAEKTEKFRVYAERARDRKWVAAAMKSTRCPRMLARGHRCSERLQNRLIEGQTMPFCPRCDLKRRGICIDCKTEPVDGAIRKALRCAACKKLERGVAELRWRTRHPGKVRQQWKRRRKMLRATGQYETMLERKRLWRLANPKAKARYAHAYSRSEHARVHQAERRLRIGPQKRAVEKERLRLRKLGILMTHPCHDCGTPLTGRPKKCDACRDRCYRAARAILTGAAA